MSASYERIMISDTIGYTAVVDPKFKTNTIKVRFIVSITPEKAAAYSLASSMLTTSCRKYPSIAALNRKMNRLYGASASVDVTKLGDYQIITASFSAIDNRYALEQEDILGELIEILKDCLFDPDITDGGFSPACYAIKVKDLLDTIDADINNKRGYALRQCTQLAYRNEPSSYPCSGTREDVLALDPVSAYNAYKELLETAAVEIFYVGSVPHPEIPAEMEKAFAAVKRSAMPFPEFVTPSPIKAEPVCETEVMDVNQCKMVLAFKTDNSDYTTMILMNLLYGGTPFSMLFANVREKLSLCYYCSSSYSDTKRTLFVDCGVEKANIEKAKDEIIRQLKVLADGDFSEELLENTRLSAYNSIKTFGDTPGSYMRWHFTELVRGQRRNVAETIAAYKAVTKSDIMAAAASLKLDTVYIMEASGEECADDE